MAWPIAFRRTGIGLALLVHAACALAATDVNQAREADLDGIKGIGPSLSSRILAERAHRQFRDWSDLITRVKGIGPAAAARLSAEGLTVNGATFTAPDATSAALPASGSAADRPTPSR